MNVRVIASTYVFCIRLPHRISIMTEGLRLKVFCLVQIQFPLFTPSISKNGGNLSQILQQSYLSLSIVFLASAAPPVHKFYQNYKTLFSQTGGVLDLSPSLFDRKCLARSTTTGYSPVCWSQSPCVQQKSFYALDPS
jgi:hypothetical protein